MFVKKGVVIPIGGAGEIDDVYTAVYGISVIERNGKIYCYYGAHDGGNARVALAVSEDGMNFIKKGVVIPIGGAGEIDDVYTAVYGIGVIERNGKIYCYYGAHDGGNARVALAVSEDGMNFIKKGVVIPIGGAGEIDDAHTARHGISVIERNGKIYCYYGAHDGGNARVALAVSEDGMNFIKKGVVIPIGGAGEIDDAHTAVYGIGVIERNGKIYCYYGACDGGTPRVALAVSEDGMNFIKKGVVIPVGGAGEIDEVHTAECGIGVIERNGKIYCYYGAYDGGTARVALAVSEDGM